MQIENDQDQVHRFQYIYFQNFKIHVQVIMYHFEHTNQDNYLYFYY